MVTRTRSSSGLILTSVAVLNGPSRGLARRPGPVGRGGGFGCRGGGCRPGRRCHAPAALGTSDRRVATPRWCERRPAVQLPVGTRSPAV
ncbi:hypothetical protein FTX61_17710 [Nitriliruptoraceae bacterium ZYF776]|nr:hypothetical protein [Profundirhabdus halotolerans]